MESEQMILPTAPEQKSILIFEAMNAVMQEVDPISKSRQGHGYKFRGIDDVYIALQAIMARNGVFTTSRVLSERSEERNTKGGGNLIYRIMHIEYTFWAIDGSSVKSEVIGEAMDSGDKASNKAMSVAHKYALMQAFCIPTEEPKDSENDHHEVRSKNDPGESPNRNSHSSNQKKTYQKNGPSRSHQNGHDDHSQPEDESHGGESSSSNSVAMFDKQDPAHLVRLEKFLKATDNDQHLELVAKELHGIQMTKSNVETILDLLKDNFSE